MNKLNNISTKQIIYVTRDIERALWAKDLPFVSIITNCTPFAKSITENNSNILLLEEDKPLDTWQLLEHKKTKTYLEQYALPHIVVFKNTKRIETTCKKNNWAIINPSAELSNRIEEKISQVEWLEELTSYLPPHRIDTLANIVWTDTPFILQFNRAHTGSGTQLISSKEELQTLQQKFPHRPVRMSTAIDGMMFTSNNVVSKDKTILGNISYQITGLAPFTDQAFATIGNDWGVTNDLLDEAQNIQYKKIVDDIGDKLRASGWRGLFGVDVIVEHNTGHIYLIEINARQPASTTCESTLQKKKDSELITIGEAHLLSLFDESVEQKDIISITDGAQIIVRNKAEKTYAVEHVEQRLKEEPVKIILYNNNKAGSDLLRIKTNKQLIIKHNTLTDLGTRIANIIKS
ncbi:MAG: hypothetical protein HOG08_02105 [Candidatus Magasanikbacteria bacterium]|mgnify:CR=1 FL=1|jgi:hypothetical protein|nr:hypothetical protein [Candidatus Magasanikbacteria bacterium]